MLDRSKPAIGAAPAKGRTHLLVPLNGQPSSPMARLWARVHNTVIDFLSTERHSGKLQRAVAEQSFFVRCDQTTMAQNDIDNGRLNIVIGVAPGQGRRIRDLQHRPMDRRPLALTVPQKGSIP